MYKNICFFNHWHNGDVFCSKQYLKELIRQMPFVNFQYAQKNTNKLLLDLKLQQISLDTVPVACFNDRFAELGDTLFINTWIGGYLDLLAELGHRHSNWINLNRVWFSIFDVVEQKYKIKLSRKPSLLSYIQETEWSFYETKYVTNFIKNRDKIVLFCNGHVNSNQSSVSDLQNIINIVSILHPDITFVCTKKFENSLNLDNIYFTDDIFADVTGGDLNEIAYLSTKVKLIVGKNSGPYMYCHVSDNIFSDTNFLALSDHPTDGLAYNLDGFKCNYYHHCGNNEAMIIKIIENILTDKMPKTNGMFQVV